MWVRGGRRGGRSGEEREAGGIGELEFEGGVFCAANSLP